jgi:hypothetical protein
MPMTLATGPAIAYPAGRKATDKQTEVPHAQRA